VSLNLSYYVRLSFILTANYIMFTHKMNTLNIWIEYKLIYLTPNIFYGFSKINKTPFRQRIQYIALFSSYYSSSHFLLGGTSMQISTAKENKSSTLAKFGGRPNHLTSIYESSWRMTLVHLRQKTQRERKVRIREFIQMEQYLLNP